MSLLFPPWLIPVAVAGGFVIGGVTGYNAGVAREHDRRVAEVATVKGEKDAALLKISTFAGERATAAKTQEDAVRIAVEDANNHWKGILDAKQLETARLRSDYDRGLARVRVAAVCPTIDRTSGDTVLKNTNASSVVDEPTVELSETAGRNILSIGAGIDSDQAKLLACQAHAREIDLLFNQRP